MHTYGDFQLCFIKDCWAYFADRPPSEVRGDDWNDSPHDCNAGPPYSGREGDPAVYRVAFEAPDLWIVGRDTFGGFVRERYGCRAANEINNRKVPWLVQIGYPPNAEIEVLCAIWAGTTLAEFKATISALNGVVWEPSNEIEWPD